MFLLLSISLLSITGWAQTTGTYAPAHPVNCREQSAPFVHQMHVLMVEDNDEEFVVHLSTRQGRCERGFFAPEALDFSYDATLIPARLHLFRRFDAEFEPTFHPNVGRVTMRFEKKLFRKRASHEFDFYFGVYGKTHYPMYFKWLVNVTKQNDGHLKLDINYLGVQRD